MKRLLSHENVLRNMFKDLVDKCEEVFPSFGEMLAIDGKGIESFANRKGKKKNDGRSEGDAEWGKHVYKGIDGKGKPWEKIKKWFGFKLHLVVDAVYELPVGFEITPASTNEMPVAHALMKRLKDEHEEMIERCRYACGDRGLDDGKLVIGLWDEYKIKPVIDIRNQWKDGEETKLVPGQENVVYDDKGTVFCFCPKQHKIREMAYGGFEEKRGTHKYRCPAKHYGIRCKGEGDCPVKHAIRIPLSVDRRVFTPVARSSYKWDTLYKRRTAVERVNSRLDGSFGFEHHTIRGLKKMSARVCLALCIMLSIAVGHMKEKQPELIRSLVKLSA